MAVELIGINHLQSEMIIILYMTIKMKEAGGGGVVDELIGSDH